MSTELFDQQVYKQSLSTTNPQHQTSAFVLRRIACFVCVFVTCAVALVSPSWMMMAPWVAPQQASPPPSSSSSSSLSEQEGAAASTAKSHVVSPGGEERRRTVVKQLVDHEEDSDDAETFFEMKIKPLLLFSGVPATSTGKSREQQQRTLKRYCASRMFLHRDRTVAVLGLEWRPRPTAPSSEDNGNNAGGEEAAVVVPQQNVNGSVPPELYAPWPHWSNKPADDDRVVFVEDFFRRQDKINGRCKSSLLEKHHPELVRLLEKLGKSVAQQRRNLISIMKDTAVGGRRRDRHHHDNNMMMMKYNTRHSPASTTFSRDAAWRCFGGKRLLFIGTSNTRTLMTNIQARLENTAQMSRVVAKQMCDNSAKNHSCFVHVRSKSFAPLSSSRGGKGQNKAENNDDGAGDDDNDVFLDYIGYKEDLFDPSLLQRIDSSYSKNNNDVDNKKETRRKKFSNKKPPPDVIIMSTGINTIQTNPNWNTGRDQRMLKLDRWIKSWTATTTKTTTRNSNVGAGEKSKINPSSSSSSSSTTTKFLWHAVTPLCMNMPHFRRYRFRKSAWSGQPVDVVNAAVSSMNKQVQQALQWSPLVRHIDSEAILNAPLRFIHKNNNSTAADTNHIHNTNSDEDEHYRALAKKVHSAAAPYCRYFEDPLHHRYLDRAIVDVLMAMIC